MEDPNNKNLLVLSIKDANDKITIGVERYSETNHVKEIGIVKNPGEKPIWSFCYKAKGPLGFPSVLYGSPERGDIVWSDLNEDGTFDQRFHRVKKKMEININDTWVKGTYKNIADANKRVQTEIGEFVFDGNTGKWEKLETK